jgi:hypothetical protein
MKTNLCNNLADLAAVQASRRRNWTNGTPADPAMEERHQIEIADIRAKLSAHENQVSQGTSEPPPALTTPSGGCVRAAGKFLRRAFRRFWNAEVSHGDRERQPDTRSTHNQP